jgi:hypothetical protein
MSDSEVNPNVGHGHVFPRPDGMKSRCGGPAMCSGCAQDLALKEAETLDTARELERLRADIEKRFKQVTVAPFELSENFTAENALTNVPSQIKLTWYGGKLFLDVAEARKLREFLDMVLP